MDIGQ